MNPLLLPFLIAMSFGMAPPEATTEATTAKPAPNTETTPQTAEPARTPEPQEPTGQFTTALEVRPILGATRQDWVAVALTGGQDLLYFSNLLAWRCGLWSIHWGVNGAPATNEVALEPCHEGTRTPNAMTDPQTYPIYVTLPGDSVQTLTVEITFDDGTTDIAQYERPQILLP